MKHLFKKNKLRIIGAGGMVPKPPPPPVPPTIIQYPAVLAPPQMGDIASINSFSYAELIDLISDGPIEGLVNKNGKKIYEENIFEGIYLNDAPIKETSSTKTQKISITFLKTILKDFWNDNKNTFAEKNRPNIPGGGKDNSTSSIDGMVQSVYRTINVGSAIDEIDNANFSSGIKITSYHPKYSSFAYLDLLNASFDARALLDKAFDLSPIENENIFLTTIEIPKFTIYVNKTFDPTEGGVNGDFPLKISIPNLGNYIYFSISSDSLNSFNYFEMPRSYVENSVLTAAGKKTFTKTLIDSRDFYQYEVFNLRIFIWSIYSSVDGIKNIDNVLDKYFNNLMVYQNDPSLYNYNLVQAEFKNGSEIQTPLKSFNKIEIENNIGKELVGPFKLINCQIASTSTYNTYWGQTRLSSLTASNLLKPTYEKCGTESSDDIRFVCAWPIEYTTKGGCPYLICNLYMNYSVYDKSSAARTCQDAVPITHYISNENVEEVYVTLSLDSLYDTAHVDMVSNNAAFNNNVNKSQQTIPTLAGTPTWANIQKNDAIVNCRKSAFFLIAGNSVNDGYIIDSSSTIAGLNANATAALSSNYFSAICSSIGLCTKITNIGNFAKQGALNTTNYNLSAGSPLRCWLIPSPTCFVKEAIQINGYAGNPTAFELKLKSRNPDGSITYPFGLSERETICANGTTFLVDCTSVATAITSVFGAANVKVAEYVYYTAPEKELKSRATVTIPINDYINWNGIFKTWNNGINRNSLDTIDNLNILYPNIKRYIVDPFLRYWSSQSTSITTFTEKNAGADVIGKIYLIGFNKHYLNSKPSLFDSNGKFLITVLDQFLEEYAFKTSSGLTSVATIEANDTLTTDKGITAGLQQVLLNFENGNLIGYSSVYSFRKVCNYALNLNTYFDDAALKNNAKVNVFTCIFGSGPPVQTDRCFYDARNVFIVDPSYVQVCDLCDQVIFYQLFSNVSAAVNNQALPAPSFVLERRSPDGSFAGWDSVAGVANATQNITAGTKLPAIVRVKVETGYECKERIDYVGDKEYFKYFFDIFGMSSTQSYIDLGRKTYDFVYGEKGSFDSGGFISKTTNLYYPNNKFYLFKITSSCNLINNCFYLLREKNNLELADLKLECQAPNQNYLISSIVDGNGCTVGYKQQVSRNSKNRNISFYVNSIFNNTAELKCHDITACINYLTNNSCEQLDLGNLTTKDSNGCIFARKALKNSKAFLGTGIFFLENLSNASSAEITSNPNKFDTYKIYTPSGFNFESYESSFTNSGISSLTYGSGFYVAVNSGAKLATSTNGTGWVQANSNFDITGVNKIIYASGLFLAAGNSGKLAISNDAITWTQQLSSFGNTGIKALAYGSGIFVAAGESGKLATSTNATSWTQQISSFSTTGICSLAYGSGIFIAVGESGKIARSSNSTTWTQVTGVSNSFGITGINCVIYGDRFFVAGGVSGKLACSNNSGTSWTQVNSSFGTTGICTLEYSSKDGVYFAGGISGKLASSYDGCSWLQENDFNSSFGNFDVRSIVYKDFFLTAGNAENKIVKSSDKIQDAEYIQIDSYNFDFSAFENVSVATCDQLKSYVPRDYCVMFYFEESIGGRSTCSNLYNSLNSCFPNDVIIQFPTLENNTGKSNIKVKSTLESYDFDWNFQNFIIRFSKAPIADTTASLTDFGADPFYGVSKNLNTLPNNCYRINLRNHLVCYFNEETLLPKLKEKYAFLHCIDDTFNFESLKTQNLNWLCEQFRSNCYFSLYNSIFCNYDLFCETIGSSKHVVASCAYALKSINIRDRANAIVFKQEPTFFNASFWTVYNPNYDTLSLIFPSGVSAATCYKDFNLPTINTINAACFDVEKYCPCTKIDLIQYTRYGDPVWSDTWYTASFRVSPGYGMPTSTGQQITGYQLVPNYSYYFGVPYPNGTFSLSPLYKTVWYCTVPTSYTLPCIPPTCLGLQKVNTFIIGDFADGLYNSITDRWAYEIKYNSCYDQTVPNAHGDPLYGNPLYRRKENCFQLCEISYRPSVTGSLGPQVYCEPVYVDTYWFDCSNNKAGYPGAGYTPAIILTHTNLLNGTKTMCPYFWIDYDAKSTTNYGLYHRGYFPYGGPTGGHVATKTCTLTYPINAYLRCVTFAGNAHYFNWPIGNSVYKEMFPNWSIEYYNPTFPADALCESRISLNGRICHRIITENISNLNAGSVTFNNENMLYFVRALLIKKGLIKHDVKLRNYKVQPYYSCNIQTANQPITFSNYRDIPFSNFDSDANNTFANDAGLAICLPAPKYYSDGTPFRRYVKVTKVSYETLSPMIQKRISLAKITEIIPQKFSYPFSSMVGLKIDSRAFSQIPIRAFDCKLKKILVPSNYFPNDEDGEDVRYLDGTGKYKIYQGDWDGTFKLSWTNNPAWILMDILVNKRYGLGNYVSSDQIDIWELYKIARWCDGVDDNGYYYGVPDSYGGTEPRHAFNGIITEKFNVFDMINQIAAIFRGHVYYMNSLITFDDDRLKPIIGEFNNSDVKDGIFNYTNLKKDDEYTAVEVAYIDEKDNYKPKIEYVEDSDGIRKRGILKKQINAFGITSKGQARRFGLHFLFQTSKENLNVTFITDMKALLYKPGDLIGINDELFNSYRNFGKIQKIKDIDVNTFEITVSPAIDENFLDTSEITLYTPTAKPKYEDILSSLESYPYKINIFTCNIITKTSSENYVNASWTFNKSEDRDLINQAYYYTGLISFNYSVNPIVKCNINATLKYEKNYDMFNNFAIKYGHWRLFTGDVNSYCQNIYLFDSLSNSLAKNTNQKKQYFFSIFDSGRILQYTGSDAIGQPLYTICDFSITGNSTQPFTITVDNLLGYSSGVISYSQIIENDRPSIENFKTTNFVNCAESGYSEIQISKYGWSGNNSLKIKDSIYESLGNLVTGSAFSFKIKNKNQPTFKIMSITENYINEYNILATEYNSEKFKLIEENASVDDLNSTFNFLNAYNSKNNTSTKDLSLKAPIIESLLYVKNTTNDKKYLNIKWSSSEKLDLLYEILIQTPSKQTNNFTISNIDSSFLNATSNRYEVNFDLEKANFEIGTYTVSIFSTKNQNMVSSMAVKSISILEY